MSNRTLKFNSFQYLRGIVLSGTALIFARAYLLYWRQLFHPFLTFLAALLYILPLVVLAHAGLSRLIERVSSLTLPQARRLNLLSHLVFIPLPVMCGRPEFWRPAVVGCIGLYLLVNLIILPVVWRDLRKLRARRGLFLDVGCAFLLTGLVFLSYYKFFRLDHFFPAIDAADVYYGSNLILGRSITQHIFPLWNPYAALGLPLYAAPESQYFFPLYLIGAMLSPNYGYYHYIFLVFVIPQAVGAIGFFILAKYLIRRRWIAFTVAVAYGFNGFAVYTTNVTQHYTVAWLPFIILFGIKAFKARRYALRYCVAAALTYALVIVSCYPILSLGVGLNLVIAAFCVGLIGNSRLHRLPRLVGRLALIFLLGAALAAPYLIASGSYLPFTGRGKALSYIRAVVDNNFPPRGLISLWFPSTALMDRREFDSREYNIYHYDMEDFNPQSIAMRSIYITLPGLLFSLIAIIRWRYYRGLPLLIAGLALFYLLLSFGGHSFLYDLFYCFLPFFSRTRHSAIHRLFFIFYLLLLAAIGMRVTFRGIRDRCLDRVIPWITGVSLFLLLGFGVYLLTAVLPIFEADLTLHSHLFHDVIFGLIFGGGTLFFLLQRRAFKNRPILIAGLSLLVVTDALGFSHARHRLMHRKIVDYEVSLKEFKKDFSSIPNVRSRADWRVADWVHDFRFTVGTIALNRPSGPFYEYQMPHLDKYLHYMNRLFKTYGRVEFAPRGKIPGCLRTGDGRTAYLEPGVRVPQWFSTSSGDKAGEDNLEILWYAPNEARVRVDTVNGCLLEMVDAYYPGWHAFIDGGEVPIQRINYSWKGVFVPAGEHEVSFRFDPPLFLPSIIFSAVTFCGAVFLCLIPRKEEAG